MAKMIGATTPMFTAVLSLLITRSQEGAMVYASLIPIVVGAPLRGPAGQARPPSARRPATARPTGVELLLGAGMGVAAGGEPSFHLLGFCLEIGATCSRALKSVVQVRLSRLQGLGLLWGWLALLRPRRAASWQGPWLADSWLVLLDRSRTPGGTSIRVSDGSAGAPSHTAG